MNPLGRIAARRRRGLAGEKLGEHNGGGDTARWSTARAAQRGGGRREGRDQLRGSDPAAAATQSTAAEITETRTTTTVGSDRVGQHDDDDDNDGGASLLIGTGALQNVDAKVGLTWSDEGGRDTAKESGSSLLAGLRGRRGDPLLALGGPLFGGGGSSGSGGGPGVRCRPGCARRALNTTEALKRSGRWRGNPATTSQLGLPPAPAKRKPCRTPASGRLSLLLSICLDPSLLLLPRLPVCPGRSLVLVSLVTCDEARGA